LLRVPGTINWKNKPEEGRVPTLAVPYLIKEGAVNDIAHVREVLAVTAGGGKKPKAAKSKSKKSADATPAFRVKIGKHDRIELDDARLKVLKPWVITLARSGEEHDHPYETRSHALFSVVCQCLRAGISEEVIAGIITDPHWQISEHVFDQVGQKLQERAAERAIEDAKAELEEEHKRQFVIKAWDECAEKVRFLAGKPNLKFYDSDYLDYDGSAYFEIEKAVLEAEVRATLRTMDVLVPAKKQDGGDGRLMPRPFVPNTKAVQEVMSAMRNQVTRAHDPMPPCWLNSSDTLPPAAECISFRNGILHMPCGRLLAATPAFFTRGAVALAYDPTAPEPKRWLKFLHEAFNDEQDQIDALQEALGYSLTGDVSQEKAFMLIGPESQRQGHGTADVARAVAGACHMRANVCSHEHDLRHGAVHWQAGRGCRRHAAWPEGGQGCTRRERAEAHRARPVQHRPQIQGTLDRAIVVQALDHLE
jgi:hypothetical protein